MCIKGYYYSSLIVSKMNVVKVEVDTVYNFLVLLSVFVRFYVGILCLARYSRIYSANLMRFGYATCVIILLTSIISLLEVCNTFLESEMSLQPLRVLLILLSHTIALPCFTTEVWLKCNRLQKEAAYLHTILGLLPVYIYVFYHQMREDLIELTFTICVLSLLIACLLSYNIDVLACIFFVVLSLVIYYNKLNLNAYDAFWSQIYHYTSTLYAYFAMKFLTK